MLRQWVFCFLLRQGGSCSFHRIDSNTLSKLGAIPAAQVSGRKFPSSSKEGNKNRQTQVVSAQRIPTTLPLTAHIPEVLECQTAHHLQNYTQYLNESQHPQHHSQMHQHLICETLSSSSQALSRLLIKNFRTRNESRTMRRVFRVIPLRA